jgi:hypothetical protein
MSVLAPASVFPPSDTKSPASRGWFLWLALLLGLYVLLVPPFQNPDEVMHFALIVRAMTPAAPANARDLEIFGLLDRSGWYRGTGIDRPELPGRLEDVDAFYRAYERDWQRQRTLYHSVAALLLRPGRTLPLLLLFYLTRLLSAGCTLLFFALGRALFFAGRPPPGWLPALAFPQVLMIGSSVSYDVFAVLFGGVFFAGLAQLEQERPRRGWSLIVVGLTLSVLTKKSGLLFPIYLALALLYWWRRGRRRPARKPVPWVWLTAVLGGGFVALHLLAPDRILPLYEFIARSLLGSSRWAPAGRFLATLGESFVAVPGWMAFPLPWPCYLPFLVLLGLALSGIARGQSGPAPLLAELALPTLALTVAAAFLWHGSTGNLAQGRYLFGLLPVLAVWLADRLGCVPDRAGKPFLVLAAGNVLLNAYLVLGFLPSAFYLLRLSPRTGL